MPETLTAPMPSAGTAGCDFPEQRYAARALLKLREGNRDAFAGEMLVVLWGPSGGGKSWLIGQSLAEQKEVLPGLEVRHATAAAFGSELAQASERRTVHEFQARWREADLVVIEDLHIIGGRRETQQQLIALFDHVLHEGGRVIVSSRLSPGEIRRVDRRLINRIQGGLIAPLPLPGRESRVELLRYFAELHDLPVTMEAAERLADALPVSPRELKAVIERIGVEAAHGAREVDDAFAARFLQTEIPPAGVSMQEIAKAVARHFAVSIRDLRSASRRKTCVLARQAAMFLARDLTSKPLRSIGRYFSGRNHTTVMHACRRIESLLGNHPTLSQELQTVRRTLAGK